MLLTLSLIYIVNEAYNIFYTFKYMSIYTLIYILNYVNRIGDLNECFATDV